jgi:hypothetical protein
MIPHNRSRRSDEGFTLVEVVVAMTVLVLIIAPLTMALVSLFMNTNGLTRNLGQSNDAQQIAAAWVSDVQSLDSAGPNNVPDCNGNTGTTPATDTPLVTFSWDNASAGAGQSTVVVPKSATWWITGSNQDAKLVRRYCESGQLVKETTVASHFGLPDTAPSNLVHGSIANAPQQFCTNVDCTIVVEGAYTYEVTGTRRVPGNAPVPPAVPPAPTITGATGRNQYITVVWKGPTVSGSSEPLTGFIVKAFTSPDTGGAAAATVTVNNASTSADLKGLTNGQQYWVVVYATSAVGNSPPSNLKGPITPNPTVPSLPPYVVADHGPAQDGKATLTIRWTAPTDDGGSAIDQYTVSATSVAGVAVPDVVVPGSSLVATIPNLDFDRAYNVTVKAHNSLGWGPTSDPVIGDTLPPPPVISAVTAQDGKALVSFSVGQNGNPANGDVPLAASGAIRITATCANTTTGCTNRTYLLDHPSPSDVNRTVGPFDTSTAPGALPLINGQSYTFTVELQNKDGVWGPPSNGFTMAPTAKPDKPTAVSIASTGQSKSLQFLVNAPYSVGSAITSYVITPTADATKAVTVPYGGDTTAFTWDGTNVPNFPLTDFSASSFTITACNSIGCSDPSSTFSATPGPTPVPASVTPLRGPTPRSANVTVASAAGTTTATQTSWTVTCTGPVTVTFNGTGGTKTVAGITPGPSTCSAVAVNTLTATVSGVASSVSLTSDPVTGSVDIYDAPGAMGAPILALPAAPGPTTSIVVTMTPYPVSSGGGDPTNTYQVQCTSPGKTVPYTEFLPQGSASYTLEGFTAGQTATCTTRATNSAGYSSTSPPSSILLSRTTPSVPSSTTIIPNGTSRQLAFTINAPYDGGYPITRYEITSNSSGNPMKTISPTGSVTSFVWDGTNASYPLTDFAPTGFTLKACNQQGCSAATASLSGMPGVAPGGTLGLAYAATPLGLNATITGTASTGSPSATSWAVDCGNGHVGSVTGLSGTATIPNLPVGIATCTAVPTNTLTSTTNGVIGTTTLVGGTVTTQSQVYDKPGAQTAPTLSLPPASTPDVTTTVYVQVNPYPVPSGGQETLVTYSARCVTTGYDSGLISGSPSTTAPVTITDAPSGKVLTCTSYVTNSAGYQSVSPSATINTARVVPYVPTNVTVVPTGRTHELSFSIVGPYDGGLPISSYKITPNASADPANTVTIPAAGSTGVATTFNWNSSTSVFALSDFSSTNFRVMACNSLGCGTASANFTGVSAVAPTASAATATRTPNVPRGLTVAVTGTAATTRSTTTTWVTTCAGPVSGSITGASGSVAVTGVSTGYHTCDLVGTNTVASTINGQLSTTSIVAPTVQTTAADVYDVPGTMTAPTLSLPDSGPLTHVLVTPNPYPVPSGGDDAGVTYQAQCNNKAPVNSGTSPIDVTGFTAGEQVTCVVVVYNSAGLKSTSPSSTITLSR